jgi:hypothetical protein
MFKKYYNQLKVPFSRVGAAKFSPHPPFDCSILGVPYE